MSFRPQGPAYEFIAKDVNLWVTCASDLSEKNLFLCSFTTEIRVLFINQYSVLSIKYIASKIFLFKSIFIRKQQEWGQTHFIPLCFPI